MVARNLHKFKGLDLGLMISEFIKTERLDVIMEIIRIFTTDYGYRKGNNKGFRTQILANELVKAEKWELLADYLHHFRGLDHTILYKLIEIGKGDAVTRSLKNFLQIEQGEKVSSLIDKLLGGGCTDPLNLAKALHEQRLSWAIAQNIEKFPGVDHIYLAKKLREQLCYWIIAQNIEKFPLVQSLYSTDHDPRFLSSIDELDFTVRTSNSLKSEGIYTLGDLVQWTENELLKTPNLGRKSLNEIKEVLASRDFRLGVLIKNLSPKS